MNMSDPLENGCARRLRNIIFFKPQLCIDRFPSHQTKDINKEIILFC